MGERAREQLKSLQKTKGVFEMKKSFKRTLALMLALATVFAVGFAASASEIDYGWWTFDDETGHLTVYADIPYCERPQEVEWFSYRYDIKSVTIVNGVTAVNKYAFHGCKNIEKIELPVTLEFIGPWAFSSCASLSDIELPGSLTSICKSAFSNCQSLSSLEIPARVNVIDDSAFSGCINLGSLEILSGHTVIRENVFRGCTELKTLRIPDGISINSNAFDKCENIETVYYTGSEESYKAMSVLSSQYNSLDTATVYYNQPATPYPVSISIGSMPEKTEYELGEELDLAGFELAVEMSDGTTQTLSDLSKMYIHDFHSSALGEARITVEHYGYKAYIPYTVVEDPNGKCGDNLKWVFDDESGVLTISGSGEMYDFKAYNSTPWYLSEAPWYEYRNDIKEVNFETRVNSIGDYAFYECNGITEINLPLSIQKISSKAFEGSGIDTIYYAGAAEDWSEISSTKSAFREMNLYFNGELHEHSYSEKTVMREATCRYNGIAKIACECGDYVNETIPALAHIPGEWETLDSGKTVKRRTECMRILEEKEEVTEETPDDEEITESEEMPEEEIQKPEAEENTGEESVEEESSVFEVIADAVEKIIDAIVSIFNKIAGLFAT